MNAATALPEERALDFASATAAVEALLVRSLELGPLLLPPELATIDGKHKGQPVRLEARAYSGPRIRYARFVRIQGGGLDIGNVLCLPAPEYPLPMFGADLVSLARVTAMVVADLSPVPGAPSAGAELAAIRAAQPDLPSAGELPEWALRWFSPEPLFARVDVGSREAALAALLGYASVFSELAQRAAAAPERAAATLRWQHAYCAAHREEDRGLMLLSKLFERERALRFLREILFPERGLA
jgi:phycocyanobilin:ferredoxin oxidoreductase